MTRTVPATTRAPGTTIHDPTYQNHSTEKPSQTAAGPHSVNVPRAPSTVPSTPSPATSNHSQHCKEVGSAFLITRGSPMEARMRVRSGWEGRSCQNYVRSTSEEEARERRGRPGIEETWVFISFKGPGDKPFIPSLSLLLPLKGTTNKLHSTCFSNGQGRQRIFNLSKQETEVGGFL